MIRLGSDKKEQETALSVIDILPPPPKALKVKGGIDVHKDILRISLISFQSS